MSRRLEVLLHGKAVGYLLEPSGEKVEFRLLDSYRNLVPRPVLGQKFEDDLERVYRARRREDLPDFFANLIPEGKLREVLEEHAGIDSNDSLALISFVGGDLPGAVAVRETEPFRMGDSAVPRDQGLSPLEAATDDVPGLRFSLAGVQLKFSMLREGETLTLPAGGRSGEWIVKLDSPTFSGLPENEISMLSWAREAGFEVPEFRLFASEDIRGLPRGLVSQATRVLALRRYDRVGASRIHQEDFAQVVGLPPSRKYDHVTYEAMALLVRQFAGEAAVYEFLRRLIFVIACGNNDAHLKNWSLIYPDTVQAALAPLYDQVATVAWPGPDRSLALKLAGVNEFGRLDGETLRRFAEAAQIDEKRSADIVTETLEKLRRAWKNLAGGLPIWPDHSRALCEHWQRVPLLREAGPLD